MANKDYERKYSSEYYNSSFQENNNLSESEDRFNNELDYDPEEKEVIEEEEGDRFGFELKMPTFERIVCKNTEKREQGELIDFLMLIFFIILLSLPALNVIGLLFERFRF